jgi:hypothetical protein
MKEMKDCISRRLDGSANANAEKPASLHFLVEEKTFKGTNQPFVSCPIQFRLRDSIPETKLCQPVWTETRHRTKVNTKARHGVTKHSVIGIDDFSIVAHEKALLGYVFFLRSYVAVKKVVDDDACNRWLMEHSSLFKHVEFLSNLPFFSKRRINFSNNFLTINLLEPHTV